MMRCPKADNPCRSAATAFELSTKWFAIGVPQHTIRKPIAAKHLCRESRRPQSPTILQFAARPGHGNRVASRRDVASFRHTCLNSRQACGILPIGGTREEPRFLHEIREI